MGPGKTINRTHVAEQRWRNRGGIYVKSFRRVGFAKRQDLTIVKRQNGTGIEPANKEVFIDKLNQYRDLLRTFTNNSLCPCPIVTVGRLIHDLKRRIRRSEIARQFDQLTRENNLTVAVAGTT